MRNNPDYHRGPCPETKELLAGDNRACSLTFCDHPYHATYSNTYTNESIDLCQYHYDMVTNPW